MLLKNGQSNVLAAEMWAEGPSAPAACSPAAGVEHAALRRERYSASGGSVCWLTYNNLSKSSGVNFACFNI